MNSTQVVITVLFGVSVVVALIISFVIIRSTSERKRRRGVDVEKLRHRENLYALAVCGALLVLLFATIFAIPYGDTETEGAQVVKVESFQFGWNIEPDVVEAGKPVAFLLRSRDAPHGFGIYRGHQLLTQAQVPAIRPGQSAPLGTEQRLLYTFDRPGTYEVNCLEFCGVGHHEMVAQFEVVDAVDAAQALETTEAMD